ncbi:hypothetical protein D3C86_2184190 [compost metagenome]
MHSEKLGRIQDVLINFQCSGVKITSSVIEINGGTVSACFEVGNGIVFHNLQSFGMTDRDPVIRFVA